MSSGKANKVIYAGTTLIDLTGDTVDSSTLKSGATAHDSTGKQITGTLTIPASQTKNVELSMASGNQSITPDSGKVLSKVTVTKPETLIPGNIKEGVSIGGVVGTLESGSKLPDAYVLETYNMSGQITKVDCKNLTEIRRYQFYFCSTLTEVNGWDSVTTVGLGAFQECTNLTISGLPSSINVIGTYAFQDVKFSPQEQIFPEGLTEIGSYSFYKCSYLKSLTLPSTITTIKANAFKSSGLETVLFRGTPKELVGTAFSGCSSLKTIAVPWAEGAIKYAPWGATFATIIYNYTET